ncbi:MAG: hypothetical protein QG670_1326 [Thermoproteota archaeon]|nr:hypothetical protein [Thermoproteota archaeon]
MIQLFAAIIALSLAYLLPGLAISYIIFPFRNSLLKVERIILSFGLSAGVVTFVMFFSYYLLGSFEVRFFVASLLLVFLLSGALYYVQIRFRKSSFVGGSSVVSEDHFLPKSFVWVFIGTTLVVLFFVFYHSLVFPIVSWDSLAEFAYLGRLYFQVKGIPTLSGATLGVGTSANFPPFVPLLYTWFYLVYGGIEELFSKAVSPLFAIAVAVVTYAFSKLVFQSKTKAWCVVFFVVTIPAFMFTAEDCLSDIPTMFYSASSLYFLYLSIKDEKRRDRAAIASGLLCGLAAWTKYNALFLVFVVLALFVLKKFAFMKVDGIFSFRQLFLFLAFFALLGAPWYVRNWVLVGNPVYPELYKIFGGKGIDSWLMQNSFDAHFTKVRDVTGLSFSIKDILLTYFTVFFKVPPFEITDMGPFIGAFSLVGLYFMLRKRENRDIFLIIWVVVYFLVWRFAINIFLRYLLPITPALAMISAQGLCDLYFSLASLHFHFRGIRGISLSSVLRVCVFILILGGAFLPTAINAVRGYKIAMFVSPFISKDDFMEIRLPGWWQGINYVNQQTPSDAIILTYDHSIQYYVNRTLVFMDEPRIKNTHLANNTEQMMSVLRSQNISYIFDATYSEDIFVLPSRSFLYANLNDSNYFTTVFNESFVQIFSVEK